MNFMTKFKREKKKFVLSACYFFKSIVIWKIYIRTYLHWKKVTCLLQWVRSNLCKSTVLSLSFYAYVMFSGSRLVRIRSQLSSNGKNTPAYRRTPMSQGRKTRPAPNQSHPPYGKYRRTPSPYLPKLVNLSVFI